MSVSAATLRWLSSCLIVLLVLVWLFQLYKGLRYGADSTKELVKGNWRALSLSGMASPYSLCLYLPFPFPLFHGGRITRRPSVEEGSTEIVAAGPDLFHT